MSRLIDADKLKEIFRNSPWEVFDREAVCRSIDSQPTANDSVKPVRRRYIGETVYDCGECDSPICSVSPKTKNPTCKMIDQYRFCSKCGKRIGWEVES